MKIFIISLDLLAALVIVATSILLIFASVSGSQRYMMETAREQNRTLNAIVASQEIAVAIDSGGLNYTSASLASIAVASRNGLASSLSPSSPSASCNGHLMICRLVTISNSTYLLRVWYENSS